MPSPTQNYDYSGELANFSPWMNLASIAATATRLFSAYQTFADDSECASYRGAVHAMWNAHDMDPVDMQQQYEAIPRLWPNDERDVLTPYYWKIRALTPVVIGLESAVDEKYIDRTTKTSKAAVGLMHNIESTIEIQSDEIPEHLFD